MFRKELGDTIKTFMGILILVVGISFFSFFFTRYVFGVKIDFSDILSPLSWISLVIISFYLGVTPFAMERDRNTFEYFFSLPVARERMLLYKVLPRFLALLAYFIMYAFLGLFVNQSDTLFYIAPLNLLVISIAVFLFSTSQALMYKKNYTIFISSVFGFGILFLIVWIIAELVDIRDEQVIIAYFTVLFGILSVILFGGFALRFKKFDISNMQRLSRRNILVIMLPVAIFLILFIGLNQFDSGKPQNYFTENDLVPTSLDKTNGFYRLWTLPEPKDVDVNSDIVIEKYKNFFDPALDNEDSLMRFGAGKYRSFAKGLLDKLIVTVISSKGHTMLWKTLAQQSEKISTVKEEFSYLLNRYQDLLHSTVVLDFSPAKYGYQPIFNLSLWLRLSKIYLAINAQDAINGQWEQGVANILANLELGRKITRGSRQILTNLIAKSIALTSLDFLNALMNRDDCPAEVYRQILAGLHPLEQSDFGNKNSFIFEAVVFANILDMERAVEFTEGEDLFRHIKINLFLQKNRTLNYMYDYTKKVISFELTPPYQWKTEPMKRDSPIEGAFWWFINPSGKSFFSYRAFNLEAILFRMYRLRTIYDMTRISAELHLKDNTSLPVQKVLTQLDTFRQTMDPCSGKPYLWNEKKNVLYSIGTDRIDDNGESKIGQLKTDFVVPIHLAGRPD